jgi:hypothetical protein
VTTMYRICGYSDLTIQAREVVKETAQQVQFVGEGSKRTVREFKGCNWFKTEREAALEILSRAERKEQTARINHELALRRLHEAQEKFRAIVSATESSPQVS